MWIKMFVLIFYLNIFFINCEMLMNSTLPAVKRHRKTKELSSIINTDLLNKLLVNNNGNNTNQISDTSIKLIVPDIIKKHIERLRNQRKSYYVNNQFLNRTTLDLLSKNIIVTTDRIEETISAPNSLNTTKSSKDLKVQFILDCGSFKDNETNPIESDTTTLPDETTVITTDMPTITTTITKSTTTIKPVYGAYKRVRRRTTTTGTPLIISKPLPIASPPPPQAPAKSQRKKSTVRKQHLKKLKRSDHDDYDDDDDDEISPMSFIGNIFESFYSFIEDMVTTNVIQPEKTKAYGKRKRRKHITPPPVSTTRSHSDNYVNFGTTLYSHQYNHQNFEFPSTQYPPIREHRSTRTIPITINSHTNNNNNNNKNILKTQIHVTSEYGDSEELTNPVVVPQTITNSLNVPAVNKSKKKKHKNKKDEYDDEEDDDDDDNDDNEDDDQYYRDQDRNDNNIDEDDDRKEDADDDDDDGDNSYDMNYFNNFVKGFTTKVKSYVPFRLPKFVNFFGGAAQKKKDNFFNSNFYWNHGQSKPQTSNLEYRRPKQPTYDYNVFTPSDTNDQKPWYNKLLSNLNNKISTMVTSPVVIEQKTNKKTTTPTKLSKTSDEYYDWWYGENKDNNNEKEKSIESTEGIESNDNKKSKWFFGFLGRDSNEEQPNGNKLTTETTPITDKPIADVDIQQRNPLLQNPQNWLGILAQQMVNSTKVTEQKPNTLTYDSETEEFKEKITYTNYQVWRLMPTTDEHLRFLTEYQLSASGEQLQWWKGPTLRGPTDILIPPHLLENVKESLDYEEILYEVILWDLGKAIQYENPQITRHEQIEYEIRNGHPLTWFRYHSFNDILKFLEYLNRKHAKYLELIHIGRSFEGHPLVVAKLSYPEQDETIWRQRLNRKHNRKDPIQAPYLTNKKPLKKPAIFIESGVHGREWITPATSTWVLNELIQGIERNDSQGETIRSIDWYIMPVLNPDGYEYSHNFDRMWRKNRSKHLNTPQSIFKTALNWLQKDNKEKEKHCFGTDLNRNWDYRWDEHDDKTKSICSEFYSGPNAFSEPETYALSKFLNDKKNDLNIFLSLHSYGQILTYPKLNSTDLYNKQRHHKKSDVLDMAQVAIASLHGVGSATHYFIDDHNELVHSHYGSSDAHAMYNNGIKFSYRLELRDTGTHGFLLPGPYIESTGKETFEMIKTMVDYL